MAALFGAAAKGTETVHIRLDDKGELIDAYNLQSLAWSVTLAEITSSSFVSLNRNY